MEKDFESGIKNIYIQMQYTAYKNNTKKNKNNKL